MFEKRSLARLIERVSHLSLQQMGGLAAFFGALQSRVFPKTLNYLGMMTGNIRLLSAIPSLGVLGPVFGLLQIAWLTWIGGELIGDSGKSKSNLMAMEKAAFG